MSIVDVAWFTHAHAGDLWDVYCHLRFAQMSVKCRVSKVFNSLGPGICGSNIKSKSFKLIIQNISLGIRCDIVLKGMPHHLTDRQSILIQVMAWCSQATSPFWPKIYVCITVKQIDVTPLWLQWHIALTLLGWIVTIFCLPFVTCNH